MKRFVCQGIVLSRTDYGEADRIINFITDSHGKVSVMAKGVRKSKAKLAGSVELFSIADLTILEGKGKIDTLMSARLLKHFGAIVKDLKRTEIAYDFLQQINDQTESQAGPEYFETLSQGLEALNMPTAIPGLTNIWYKLRLLKLAGHSPNFDTNKAGQRLTEAKRFSFDSEAMHFVPSPKGRYTQDHIKFLRLAQSAKLPQLLSKVQDAESYEKSLKPLIAVLA